MSAYPYVELRDSLKADFIAPLTDVGTVSFRYSNVNRNALSSVPNETNTISKRNIGHITTDWWYPEIADILRGKGEHKALATALSEKQTPGGE